MSWRAQPLRLWTWCIIGTPVCHRGQYLRVQWSAALLVIARGETRRGDVFARSAHATGGDPVKLARAVGQVEDPFHDTAVEVCGRATYIDDDAAGGRTRGASNQFHNDTLRSSAPVMEDSALRTWWLP